MPLAINVLWGHTWKDRQTDTPTYRHTNQSNFRKLVARGLWPHTPGFKIHTSIVLFIIICPLFIEHGSDEMITQACAYLFQFVKIYHKVQKQWQGKLS